MDLGNLTPDLVRSVIYYESTFRTGVVSHRNAIGLMGIRATTETGKVVWLKKLIEAGIIKVETDLYRPANNIEAGVFILNTYYDLHNGDMKKVLRNYIGSSTLATKYMKGVPDDGRE
jgi:soluble lytic murein transglycosylase-like protein